MKKKIILFLILLSISPTYAEKIYTYSVKAFGIKFATAVFTEKEFQNKIVLYTKVKSNALSSIIYNANNRYLTILDKKTLLPLFQKKYIDKKKYETTFIQGKKMYISNKKKIKIKYKALTTLFATFYYIKEKLPQYNIEFPAISCDTFWKIKIIFINRKNNISHYQLKFKFDENDFQKAKNRYNDIFIKEIFWNSSVVDLYIDTEKHILKKAILNSFSPKVILTLKD